MFQCRAPIPHDARYARLRPSLDDYDFPSAVAKQVKVDDLRTIALLRADIESLGTGSEGGATLRYIVPWGPASVKPGSVDLVVSQAVLQEMPNGRVRSALRDAIGATASWLRPGGIASHQIDLGMYGLEPWNIHWSWSDAVWKTVRGRRENFVNREPLSTYLSLFRQAGFSIIAAETEQERGVDDASLNRRFRALDREEREARSVLLIVQKNY